MTCIGPVSGQTQRYRDHCTFPSSEYCDHPQHEYASLSCVFSADSTLYQIPLRKLDLFPSSYSFASPICLRHPPLPSTSKSIDQTSTNATFPKQVSSNHKNLLYILPEEARSFIFPDPLKRLPVQLRLEVRFQHPLIHPERPSWRARLTTDGRKFPKLMLLSFYSKDTKITERDCPRGGTLSQKDPAALISEARVEW